MRKAFLYLENGQVLEGKSFGAEGTALGELVFTTNVTGAIENLTDPSYFGQLVIYTFPMLANYGICRADMVSPKAQMGGVVVREYCEEPSNFRCDTTVDAFLKEQGVVGIAGIDTRMLTQLIRDNGVMNAIITTEETQPDLSVLKTYQVSQAVETTSGTAVEERLPEGQAQYSVALIDYGSKEPTAEALLAKGCKVTVYPYNTPAETILAGGHQGVALSNGPGDPMNNPACVEQIKALLGKLPIFAVCLGHQMLALAAGGKTTKLKFGHRGSNQPVKDLETGSVLITSQNHGYAVDGDSLAGTQGKVRYVNVNDGTCEGADYPAYKALGLQFDPAVCPAALDRFADLMKEGF